MSYIWYQIIFQIFLCLEQFKILSAGGKLKMPLEEVSSFFFILIVYNNKFIDLWLLDIFNLPAQMLQNMT